MIERTNETGASVDELEALAKIVADYANYSNPMFHRNTARAILAAGFHLAKAGDPEPTEQHVLDALNAYDPRRATDDISNYAPENVAKMRNAVRAVLAEAQTEMLAANLAEFKRHMYPERRA